MTSAADTEMFTARQCSLRRRFQNYHQFPTRKVALFFRQPDADSFPRQPKWDKDRPPIFQASHSIAAIGECSESNFVFHKQFGRPIGAALIYFGVSYSTCIILAVSVIKVTEGRRKEQPTQQ